MMREQKKSKRRWHVLFLLAVGVTFWLCFQGRMYHFVSPSTSARAVFFLNFDRTVELEFVDQSTGRVNAGIIEDMDVLWFDEAYWSKDGTVCVIKSLTSSSKKGERPIQFKAYDFKAHSLLFGRFGDMPDIGEKQELDALIATHGGESKTRVTSDTLAEKSRYLWPWELGCLW